MRKLSGPAAVLATTTVVGVAATVGTAAASTGALDLGLNEAAGAKTAVDGSGHHHNGRIGSRVRMGGGHATFPVEPKGADLDTSPLIVVPDAKDGSLDPGSGAFTIVLRYRTTHGYGNVLQKGQATSSGGQVKLQQPGSRLTCMFKTSAGTATAGSGSVTMDNGAWHTVRCVRTATSVTMYVDGKQTGKSAHRTGKLDNTMAWTIGGKPNCNGDRVDCDYFAGDIDYVRLTKG
jgi:hypothetical protein